MYDWVLTSVILASSVIITALWTLLRETRKERDHYKNLFEQWVEQYDDCQNDSQSS